MELAFCGSWRRAFVSFSYGAGGFGFCGSWREVFGFCGSWWHALPADINGAFAA